MVRMNLLLELIYEVYSESLRIEAVFTKMQVNNE